MKAEMTLEERRKARAARKAALRAAKERQRESDEVTLDDLEVQHGDENVQPVYTQLGMIVIGRPRKVEIDRYQEMVLRDGKPGPSAERKRRAAETLAKSCLLHPPAAVYEEWCEKCGGIPTTVAAAALAFANVMYEEEAGK